MEEIELTFLVKELPVGFDTAENKEIIDIYIPDSVEMPILRVRKSGEKYEITKKQQVDGDASRHLETTIPLTQEEFEELSTLSTKKVQKNRYYLTNNGVDYEIDVFKGPLEGLVLADVEFDSLEGKASFQMPRWCLVDVTQEKFIAGSMLCGKTYAKIEEKLNSFGYKKVI